MRIAVTRLEEKRGDTKELFERYGAEAIILPSMKAADPADTEPLLALIDAVGRGESDFLIFTSSLGVDKWLEYGGGFNTTVICVGPVTARRLGELGVESEFPESYSADQIPQYLSRRLMGARVGIARANVENPGLVEGLKQKGASVAEAPAYELHPIPWDSGVLDGVDAVIFTSGRSFEYAGVEPEMLRGKRVVAIGPKTAEHMRRLGVDPEVVGDGTLEGCLRALGLQYI